MTQLSRSLPLTGISVLSVSSPLVTEMLPGRSIGQASFSVNGIKEICTPVYDMAASQNAFPWLDSDRSTSPKILRGDRIKPELNVVITSSTTTGTSMLMPTVTLDECVKKFIGKDSFERFEHFAAYHDGWDGGRGKSVSPMSVAMMNTFIHMAIEKNRKPSTTPSLFMTHDGILQIIWEDKEGRAIDLEFTEHGIEFYFEASEKEGIAKPNQIFINGKTRQCKRANITKD